MKFGDALEAVKAGHKAARSEWGMDWLSLVTPLDGLTDQWIGVEFVILRGDRRIVPYTPTQEDLLAGDWEIIYVH